MKIKNEMVAESGDGFGKDGSLELDTTCGKYNREKPNGPNSEVGALKMA